MNICPKCSCKIGCDDIKYCPNGCGFLDDKEEILEVLRGIINGCVHPEIAIRAVFVDLKPIKKILNKYEYFA